MNVPEHNEKYGNDKKSQKEKKGGKDRNYRTPSNLSKQPITHISS